MSIFGQRGPQANPDFVIEDEPGGRTLVVTGVWSRDAESALKRGHADGLVVNYARGCRERSLDFLGEWPVRRLAVLARTYTDATPIYRLSTTLEELRVTMAERAEVDLARLPRLLKVRADWTTVRGSLDGAPHLQDLLVCDYDGRDLAGVSASTELRTLVLKVAPMLETLDGAEDLPSLGILEVLGAGRLQSLEALGRGGAFLTELAFEGCQGIHRVDRIARLTRLRLLGLSDCGRLESIGPISSLTQLEIFRAWGSTRVEDADLSPLAGLPHLAELRMRDRPEYRPRVKDIQNRIGWRP
jgi:hypothetical protein